MKPLTPEFAFILSCFSWAISFLWKLYPLTCVLSQALELIRELQKHFPIKRSPMRLRLIIPEGSISPLLEKLSSWGANIISKDESGSQLYVVSLLAPMSYYL